MFHSSVGRALLVALVSLAATTAASGVLAAPNAKAQPVPTVTLSASRLQVTKGETVKLNWNAKNADRCVASGAWAGRKGLNGSQVTGRLTNKSTFVLQCTRGGAKAVTMLSIDVNGVVNLQWVAPRQYEDGKPLKDLAGYRLYYGEKSGAYTKNIQLGKNVTRHALKLPVGSHYVFALKAIAANGSESAFSSELKRRVN